MGVMRRMSRIVSRPSMRESKETLGRLDVQPRHRLGANRYNRHIILREVVLVDGPLEPTRHFDEFLHDGRPPRICADESLEHLHRLRPTDRGSRRSGIVDLAPQTFLMIDNRSDARRMNQPLRQELGDRPIDLATC